MIPEGVLAPVHGGFRIYLQNNFIRSSVLSSRQRFTIAHELTHTFYYDKNAGIPQRAKGSPKGSALERLCHIGAGQILVPDTLLKRETATRGEIGSAEAILDLAGVFEVSPDVIIRRVHAAQGAASYDFAAIFVDVSNEGKRLIRAACYSPLLLCNAGHPRVGLDFDSWVARLRPSSTDGKAREWTHRTSSNTVLAKKVNRSGRSFILDLRFR